MTDTNPAVEAAAEKLKEALKSQLAGTATKEELKALDAQFTKALEDKVLSLDDVQSIVKDAVAEHIKSAGVRPTIDRTWKDHPEKAGHFLRTIVLPSDAQFKAQVQHGIFKATLDQATDVAGAPVAGYETTYALAQGNPYRQDVTVIPMSAGTARLPVLNALTFTRTKSSNVPDKTPQGNANTALAFRPLNADLVEALIQVGNPTMEDLPGIRSAVEGELMQRYATNQAIDITANIKSSANGSGGITAVPTGAAAALPAATAAVDKAADMVAAVSAPYRMGAVWHISRAFEAVLNIARSSANGEYAFNPAMGVMTLLGYPVRVNDSLEDGGTASDISAVFGSFRNGIALGERATLDIEDNPYTTPGHRTFYAMGRDGNVVWHPEALVALSTGT